jgi:hypothetical protein
MKNRVMHIRAVKVYYLTKVFYIYLILRILSATTSENLSTDTLKIIFVKALGYYIVSRIREPCNKSLANFF